MNEFLKSVAAGTELRTPDLGADIVDFALSQGRRSLVCYSGWWSLDWPNEQAVRLFDSPFVLRATDNTWIQADAGYPAYFADPSDGDAAAKLVDMRLVNALNKTAYLAQLAALSAAYPDFDFGEWQTHVQALVVPDVDALLGIDGKTTRKIGGLFLADQDNAKLDVLILDEQGAATTCSGSSWLSSFIGIWHNQNHDQRPSLEDFVDWISRQSPYGPLKVSAPFVRQEAGTIEQIAARLMSGVRAA